MFLKDNNVFLNILNNSFSKKQKNFSYSLFFASINFSLHPVMVFNKIGFVSRIGLWELLLLIVGW